MYDLICESPMISNRMRDASCDSIQGRKQNLLKNRSGFQILSGSVNVRNFPSLKDSSW